MFHVTWTTFKFNRNQLGMVSVFVMISVPWSNQRAHQIISEQLLSKAVAWWPGGGGGAGRAVAPSDNFLAALKFVIPNVKYYTKYVKYSLSTNSKILVILAFL